MFDHTSRYYAIETATLTLPDGRRCRLQAPPLPAAGEEMPLLAEVAVAQGERLDLLAHRTLGDPLAVLAHLRRQQRDGSARELTDRAGPRRCAVPLPQSLTDSPILMMLGLHLQTADRPDGRRCRRRRTSRRRVQSVQVTHNDEGQSGFQIDLPGRPRRASRTCSITRCCATRCCGRSTA